MGQAGCSRTSERQRFRNLTHPTRKEDVRSSSNLLRYNGFTVPRVGTTVDKVSAGLAESDSGLTGWLRRNRGKSAIAAVFAVLIAWFAWPEDEESLPAPATVPVVRGDIESSVAASGTLEAGGSVDIGAQVSGQLNRLHAKLGDIVSEGDLLAEIDSFIQTQRVASQEANLESLEANTPWVEASLQLARADLARQKRLMEAQATTEVEYDRAVVQLTQSEASLTRHFLQIEQARASLEEARQLLNYTRITAPSTGTIVNVLAQEGQTLNALQVTPIILRIGNLSTIRVIAKIPEADVARLTTGMEAYFTTVSGGGRRWEASLLEISPIPEATGGLGGLTYFDALLEVDNADGALLPGMGAKVFFLIGSARNVLKVPLGALTFGSGEGPMSAAGQFAMGNAQGSEASRRRWRRGSGGAWQFGRGNNSPRGDASGLTGRFRGGNRNVGDPAQSATVQVMNSEGAVETREVKIGFSNNVEAEVISGLAEGEWVVSGARQPDSPDMQFGGFRRPMRW